MIGLALAVAWFGIVLVALRFVVGLERSSRLAGLSQRFALELPRRDWGGGPDRPPAAYAAARALASFSRMVREPTRVAGTSVALRWVSRALSLVATASALALLPFAGTWGASPQGRALVVVDLEFGLGLLVFLVLIGGLAQATGALAEGSVWARLGAARVAGRNLVGVSLLLLVLAPLALATESLRLHEIVRVQQEAFVPLAGLANRFGDLGIEGIERFRLPGWFLLRQPLTAVLVAATLILVFARSAAHAPVGHASGAAAVGMDAGPSELYWGRLEMRLSVILAAGLFVALFLGAGDLPFLVTSGFVARLSPLLGEFVPSLLLFALAASVFAAKLVGVLFAVSLLHRSVAAPRIDQSVRVATRRLLPLAWANLLLVSAISLLDGSLGKGLS